MERREFLIAGVAAPGLMLADLERHRTRRVPAPAVGTRRGERFEELAALVAAKMEELRIPGVALGVLKDGELLLRGFGVTNVEDPQPVTADTVFPIASISKTVATTALLRLVEQGRLDLDAPVRRYLTDFRVGDETVSREVTLWHLLTHSPGWEGQLGTADRGDLTLANFTESMADLPQLAAPGEVWSYNNAGFGVAGRVIEVVTEQNIHTALRDLVFAPLGLTHAFSRTGDVLTYRFALPHRAGPDGEPAVIRPFTLFPNVTAGGTAMSLASLLRYAAFHLGDGRAGSEAVLSRASLERMRTPQLRKHPTEDDIGLAWQLRPVGGVLTAAHGGTLGGHVLHVQLVPERELAFAILTNHSVGWRLIQEVERAALRIYEGLALEPNQRIAHRGLNEDMTAHAVPLAVQPAPAPYLGSYRRPPLGGVQVREEDGRLMVDNTAVAFYGSDVAYAATGGFVGRPYEFVRTAGGDVRWIRVNGRIARKDG